MKLIVSYRTKQFHAIYGTGKFIATKINIVCEMTPHNLKNLNYHFEENICFHFQVIKRLIHCEVSDDMLLSKKAYGGVEI
jgi:hypothetical protein